MKVEATRQAPVHVAPHTTSAFAVIFDHLPRARRGCCEVDARQVNYRLVFCDGRYLWGKSDVR